ncbi:MAG TPA: glycosyltransferase family A protein, partial [Arachidicoccus sp.]
MDELISVVIPCYNDGIYLQETFEKLKLQTYKYVEVIIVNDGSTDEKTLQLLQQLSNEQNVRIIHKQNGKLPAARNSGIKEARGNIIVTLDADDYFEKTFFEKSLKILQQDNSIGSVISYTQNYDGNH